MRPLLAAVGRTWPTAGLGSRWSRAHDAQADGSCLVCAIAQLRRTAGKAAQDARATAAGRSVQLAGSLGKPNARWHAEVDPFGPAAAPWQHHAVGWTGGWRLHAATQSYLAAPAASATGTGLMLPRSTSRYNVCVIWSCLLVSGHASGRVACGAF